jgi:sugar lactone lactonase YvrE
VAIKRGALMPFMVVVVLASGSPLGARDYSAILIPANLHAKFDTVMLSDAMENPVGFAWEAGSGGGPEFLWAVDIDRNKVIRVAASGGARREYNVGGVANLESIFFNNLTRKLWALDTNGKTLYRGFTIVGTGAAATLTPITANQVDIQQVADRAPISGLTLDPGLKDNLFSNLIWVSRGGGLCSCVELRNPDNQEVIGRFFPKCEPIDISIGPDGKRLWILADNGPGNPMVLIERRLHGPPSKRVETAGGRTERFYTFDTDFRPIAIAAADKGVWLMTGPGQSDLGRVAGNENKTYAIRLKVKPPPTYLFGAWGP